MVESTISPVQFAKVTDVSVRYGWMILTGTIKEVHSNWMMIKVQAVTDSEGGAKITDSWLTGRDLPVAISDRVFPESPKITTENHPAV